MSTLSFTPWRPFEVFRDHGVTTAYLRRIGATAAAEFRNQTAASKSGRVYMRRGKAHQASAPGEYPARDSGAHSATIDFVAGVDRVEVGSGMFYAKYLRYGTSKMAPRRMSQDALRTAISRDGFGIGRFVRFRQL